MFHSNNDAVWLACMRTAIAAIQDFTAGMDLAAFLADAKTQAAVLHELMVLGEAMNHMSDAWLEAHPDIPWFRVIGLRNVVVHEYFGVNLVTVWTTIQRDLPTLSEPLRRADSAMDTPDPP